MDSFLTVSGIDTGNDAKKEVVIDLKQSLKPHIFANNNKLFGG